MLARALALILAAVLIQFAAPSPAAAQTRGQIRRARALFDRGLRQYDRHRYEAALRTFTRAYQLAPAAPVVYNIAQCHVALGREDRAVESYRLFLQLAPDAPNRAEVERKIRQLERHIAAERHREQQRVAAEVRREQREIVDSETLEQAREDEEEAGRGGHVRLVTWITLGTGILVTGAGVLFHLDAVAQQDELDDPQLDCRRAIGRCRDIVESGDRSAMLRTVLLPLGGAVIVTGVVMMIANLGTEDRPDGIAFGIGPLLGPDVAALEVRGSW